MRRLLKQTDADPWNAVFAPGDLSYRIVLRVPVRNSRLHRRLRRVHEEEQSGGHSHLRSGLHPQHAGVNSSVDFPPLRSLCLRKSLWLRPGLRDFLMSGLRVNAGRLAARILERKVPLPLLRADLHRVPAKNEGDQPGIELQREEARRVDADLRDHAVFHFE